MEEYGAIWVTGINSRPQDQYNKKGKDEEDQNEKFEMMNKRR